VLAFSTTESGAGSPTGDMTAINQSTSRRAMTVVTSALRRRVLPEPDIPRTSTNTGVRSRNERSRCSASAASSSPRRASMLISSELRLRCGANRRRRRLGGLAA
jgi:hypothetical protein